MLRVVLLTGEPVATFDAEDVALLGPSEPCFTSSLKKYLQPLLGASACRQRLLCNGTVLFDDCSFEDIGMPEELQVLVVPYAGENPRELMMAVKEGNECEVRRALEKGIDPNIEEGEGRAIIWLLRLKLPGNSRNQVAGTPALPAVNFELLSEHDFQAFTPLYCAALSGRLDLVKLLLDAGADKDACSGGPGHFHARDIRRALDSSPSASIASGRDAFENTSGSSRLDDDVYMELLSEVQYFPHFGTRAHYLAFELHDLWQRTPRHVVARCNEREYLAFHCVCQRDKA
eukprot:s1566_g9.t1